MRRYVILLFFLPFAAPVNSCTSDFCPPVLAKHKIKIERELPRHLIGKDEENGCHCAEVPNVYSVCYHINSFSSPCMKYPRKIPIVTRTLIIKTTHIKVLTNGDFDNLTHLDTLMIDNNQYLTSLQPYIFKNLTNLTSLSFISNPLLVKFEEETFYGLVKLKELNLVKNGFQNIRVLASAMRPAILPSLLRIDLSENYFENINEDDFEPMQGSRLEELNLISCGIDTVHPRALKPLKSLAILLLGSNRFDVVTLVDLLTATINFGIDLKVLDLYLSGLRGTIPQTVLEVIAKSNISSLILKRNQFDSLGSKLFPVYMPKMIMLDLTDVSAHTIHDQAFSNLPNLKTLILGDNKLPYFAASRHLPNLTYLDLRKNTDYFGSSEFALTKSELHKMKLHYLDLQFTRLLVLTETDFGYMPYLSILNLKNCSIFKIENNTFKGMPNLRFLNLNNNIFFNMWIKPSSNFDMFGGLENLEILELEGNAITTLRTPSKHLLKHLKNLKHLGLIRNSLQSISSEDFAHLTNLEVLDISQNGIISWDFRVFPNTKLKKFYANYNKMTRLSEAMLQDFRYLKYIEIGANSLICDCFMKEKTSSNLTALIQFSKLIEKQKLYCLRPSEPFLSFLQNITQSKLNCDSGFSIVVFIYPFLIFVVIFSILAILVYVYRWHIRYWLFLIRIYLIRKGKIKIDRPQGHNNFQFDAFVSYCNHDQNFVVKLVKMLENNEPYLRLCIYERDFQVGTYISESVLEHISKSRKTILVVSDSYAKSYWCNWESQIAEHHRLFSNELNGCVDESIVLIKLGNFNEANLNPTLRFILKTRIYLEWDTDEQKQEVFWRKLRQFLTPRKNDNFEDTHM